MEKSLILVGLLLILVFFGFSFYSIAGIKKRQHHQAAQLKRILMQTSDYRLILSEYLLDNHQVLLKMESQLTSYLNSQESWVDYSFRKPEEFQRVSLLLEDDEIVFKAQYNPLNKTFHSAGLNISPLKVKQWKKSFS